MHNEHKAFFLTLECGDMAHEVGRLDEMPLPEVREIGCARRSIVFCAALRGVLKAKVLFPLERRPKETQYGQCVGGQSGSLWFFASRDTHKGIINDPRSLREQPLHFEIKHLTVVNNPSEFRNGTAVVYGGKLQAQRHLETSWQALA
ncbi:MAG: hypothetical protein LBK72_08425 [Bifidobacteriaceae bacterium]|jgi:hypothetical protein|nr:hypothetical protein [Bifidobacteriaceae bacterium]